MLPVVCLGSSVVECSHGKRETLGSSPGRAAFFFRPCDKVKTKLTLSSYLETTSKKVTRNWENYCSSPLVSFSTIAIFISITLLKSMNETQYLKMTLNQTIFTIAT